MRIATLTVLAASALLFFPVPAVQAGCGACGGCPAAKAAPADHTQADLVDTAVAAGDFQTLVAAVKAAGLVETLKGDGPFTVFAPSDAAFARLPEGTVSGLLAAPAKLRQVLTYHVVPGRLSAADVAERGWLTTVQGQSLKVEVSGDEVRIDGARISATDVEAVNGLIHVIDSVVLPRKNIVETAAAAGTFQTLLAAAKAAGLAETLKGGGPFTIFAPSDAAFAKLPEGTVAALLQDLPRLKAILTYHVVPGRVLSTDLKAGSNATATVNGKTLSVTREKNGAVSAGGASVVQADLIAGNGVIHVVDNVILPR